MIRRRLAGQHLTAAGLPGVVDVVRSLGAVQAQDYAGAKWAIAQRARDATDAVVERLFNDGRILRTHVLRPTWHFVLPEDIRWMRRTSMR
ncbi:MAG TPA: crosslink repair DNA glycosylase YcaQ family protein [Gemmatimonadaceae bacterium]|nr:crosslink repair DNA glycosylase YcaQ family protein [Gemmatimonadaceae bacterium]